MQKDYVLDASILLRDPDSLFGFADNRVHITYATIMELSAKLSMKGDPGHNAKEALDNINKLIEKSTDPRVIPHQRWRRDALPSFSRSEIIQLRRNPGP